MNKLRTSQTILYQLQRNLGTHYHISPIVLRLIILPKVKDYILEGFGFCFRQIRNQKFLKLHLGHILWS